MQEIRAELRRIGNGLENHDQNLNQKTFNADYNVFRFFSVGIRGSNDGWEYKSPEAQ